MKPIWKEIIRIVVNAIVAITTVLTATSCMQVNKHTDESPLSNISSSLISKPAGSDEFENICFNSSLLLSICLFIQSI